MADRPLRPATRRCLGEPLPHQQADRPRVHPEAQRHFLIGPCDPERVFGINPGFPGLSRSSGQVTHVLLTRSPLRHPSGLPLRDASLDMHAFGAPPAFVLSQDQTLHRTFMRSARHTRQLTFQQSSQCRAIQRSSSSTEVGPEDVIALSLLAPEPSFAMQCTTTEVSGARASSRRSNRGPPVVSRRVLTFGTLSSCQGAAAPSPAWGEATDHGSRCSLPARIRHHDEEV